MSYPSPPTHWEFAEMTPPQTAGPSSQTSLDRSRTPRGPLWRKWRVLRMRPPRWRKWTRPRLFQLPGPNSGFDHDCRVSVSSNCADTRDRERQTDCRAAKGLPCCSVGRDQGACLPIQTLFVSRSALSKHRPPSSRGCFADVPSILRSTWLLPLKTPLIASQPKPRSVWQRVSVAGRTRAQASTSPASPSTDRSAFEPPGSPHCEIWRNWSRPADKAIAKPTTILDKHI